MTDEIVDEAAAALWDWALRIKADTEKDQEREHRQPRVAVLDCSRVSWLMNELAIDLVEPVRIEPRRIELKLTEDAERQLEDIGLEDLYGRNRAERRANGERGDRWRRRK